MKTCWPGYAASRIAAVLISGALIGLPAQAASDYSAAEQAIFLDNHLERVVPPQTLHYAYTRRGSLETSFDDGVDIKLTAQPDGSCCKASTRFLDSTRGTPLPAIDGLHGNPVILYFLERDIHEMQRRTKGQANYFRNRIRMAIYQSATIRSIELPYRGRNVAIREITVSPYEDDPLRARFEKFANKQYVFQLSSEVPGGVYAIRTVMADGAATALPLVVEQLTLDGASAP